MTIKTKSEDSFYRGRNGYGKLKGLNVDREFSGVVIRPINSKGDTSNSCVLPIPDDILPALIEALKAQVGKEFKWPN